MANWWIWGLYWSCYIGRKYHFQNWWFYERSGTNIVGGCVRIVTIKQGTHFILKWMGKFLNFYKHRGGNLIFQKWNIKESVSMDENHVSELHYFLSFFLSSLRTEKLSDNEIWATREISHSSSSPTHRQSLSSVVMRWFSIESVLVWSSLDFVDFVKSGLSM